MGLVEGILREVDHFIIDSVCDFFTDAVCYAAGYVFLFISVYKVLPLLFHDGSLLFTHGTANQIGSSHGITGQIPDDLHYLLLVNDAAIGVFKYGLNLRAVVAYMVGVSFSFDVLGNEIHGARSVKSHTCYDVLYVLRLQLLHEVLHARRFQLEHALAFALGYHLINLGIGIINLIYVEIYPVGFINIPDRILYNRKGSESQEIHLEKSQLLNGGHGELSGDGAVGAP